MAVSRQSGMNQDEGCDGRPAGCPSLGRLRPKTDLGDWENCVLKRS